MTVTRLCMAVYQRPDGTVLRCHYLPDHPVGRHSWHTASMHDREVANAVVAQIIDGLLDAYLEAILAAAHTRKRVLRGVIT